MLRLKILVSVVPVIGAAMLARIELFQQPRPCINLGADTMQMAALPGHADLHVSFTDDPALATVRVTLTDNAALADFAVVDDADETADGACASTTATQLVAISDAGPGDGPVIYLGHGGRADYRIFVSSAPFTAREAAALIVSAHHGRSRLADASF